MICALFLEDHVIPDSKGISEQELAPVLYIIVTVPVGRDLQRNLLWRVQTIVTLLLSGLMICLDHLVR